VGVPTEGGVALPVDGDGEAFRVEPVDGVGE
jgi:hypothetical protein